MASKTPTVFTTVFGSYTSTKQLGEGGSGRVFAVTNEDGKPFAVKLLDPAKATTDKLRRFKNEIFFGRTIAHPHIAQVLDSGVVSVEGSRSAPFFVMPLYGSTLRSAMRSGITPDLGLRYFGQIIDGIEAAHLQNVWHRDVKPENILIDGPTTAVVADFGIARFAPSFQETMVNTLPHGRLANFAYAAPEQRTGGTVDHRADIFALGLILNEMITGTVPHGTGYPLIASKSASHAYLDELVSRMLANRPEDRPPTIDEVKKELISRHNDFISRQKVDALRKTVVPASAVTDPIATDPIQVIGGEWDNDHLVFVLNRAPPVPWQEICRNVPLSHLMNYPPRLIKFSGKNAFWPARQDVAQKVIDMFKERVSVTNREYLKQLNESAQEQERAERRRLQDAADAEERRRRANAKLRF